VTTDVFTRFAIFPQRLAMLGFLGLAFLAPHPAQAQSTSTTTPPNPGNAGGAASQAGAPADDDEDDGVLQLAQPDFRVVNLPTTLRLPVRGSSFQLTHRFNGNLRRGSFSDNASNLFGLDQGAVVGFEYRFGIARHLQAIAYRTAIDKTFQFYGKYDALRQNASIPVGLSALVSIEGGNNFQDRYAPALGASISRTAGDRLALYVTPIWVHNTAAILDIDRDTFFVGVGGRLRVSATVYVVAESSPRLAGYRPGEPEYAFGFERRAGGHMFQMTFANSQGTTFAQTARGGFPDALFLGFNLARKFF
jgi:hypothetical protein